MSVEFSITLCPKFSTSQGVPRITFAETKLLVAASLPRTPSKAGEMKEGGITGSGGSGPLHAVLEVHGGKAHIHTYVW